MSRCGFLPRERSVIDSTVLAQELASAMFDHGPQVMTRPSLHRAGCIIEAPLTAAFVLASDQGCVPQGKKADNKTDKGRFLLFADITRLNPLSLASGVP